MLSPAYSQNAMTSILEFVVPSSPTYQDFGRRTLDDANLESGVWPFGCQRLVPCPDVPHQTCGCLNPSEPGTLALVYNLDAQSKTIRIL